MQIYERNGFIFLKDFPEDYEWLTYGYTLTDDPYFILNNYTREYFKQDILPYIKSKQCYIPLQLYNKIKYYKGTPTHDILYTLKNLPGIIYKPHQVTALNKMLTYKRFGFFLGPGSGKTIIAIGFLYSLGIKSALIVTPEKVVTQYTQEVNKYISNNNFIITNYEQLHKYATCTFDAVILDESHKVKNYSSKANELCRFIASKAQYVYLFTGTPQDKSRHEILSQLAILDERVMPGKTRTLFRYFNQDDYYNPSSEKRTFSKELSSVIESYTWGRKTEEVVQLTKENNYTIKCETDTDYYTLADKRVLKKTINGITYRCVADNKGVLKIKLREICSGHLILEDLKGGYLKATYTHKQKELQTLLNKMIDKNCIIYYEFDNDIPFITKVLESLNINYVLVNGKTSKKLNNKNLEDFKQNNIEILVMQSKSGNAGLDLTNVNNIIFYSLPESYIVFTQCKARINRIGQTKECNYYYLVSKNSVDEQILNALNKKKNFSTRLFKIYN